MLVCHLYALFCEMAAHSLVGLFGFFYCCFEGSLFILDVSMFSNRLFADTSSQSVACFFILLIGSLTM